MRQRRQVSRGISKGRSVAGQRIKLSVAAMAAVIATRSAHGADRALYWDTNGSSAGFGSTTATWGTSADWNTDSTGAAAGTAVTTTLNTDDLNFNASGALTVNVSGGVVCDHINFGLVALGGYGYTVQNGTSITIGGGASTPGITFDNQYNTNIATPLILAANATFLQDSYPIGYITGGITGTGNLTLQQADGAHEAFQISGGAINNSGVVYSTGSATSSYLITSPIGSGVTGVQDGAGTLILAGVGTYTGTTTISSGATIQTNAANIMPNGSTAGFVSDSGLFNLSGHSQTINGLTGAGTVDSFGTATLSIGANNSTSTFTGVLQNSTGSLSIAKVGSGTLLLGGTSTYSGGSNITGGGVLAAGSAKALGASSTVSFGNTYGQGNEGTLQFNVAPVNTYGVSFLTYYGNSATIQANYSSPAITFGVLTLSQNNTLNLTAGSGATGTAPAYTFASTGGTYGAGNNTTSSYINPTGATASLGAMTPVAVTVSGVYTQTLTLEGNTTGNTLGAVSNGPGSVNYSMGAITESGTGSWTLTAANTYTGPTKINSGTLILDHTAGTGSLGNTAVSIAGGGTLLVKGTTSIGNTGPTMNVAGGTTTATQGTLSLVDGSINTLNLSGNLAFGTGTSGAILAMDLGPSSGLSDLLNVAGSVTTNGVTTINFNASSNAPLPGTYTLIQTGVASFTNGAVNASTGFVVGTHPSGFYSYTLADSSTQTLQLTISGAGSPAVAYWTGAASLTGGDTANNWGYGASLSTTQSNWSSDQAGEDDTLQVPGANTSVFFTANNYASGELSTQLDSGYSIMGLTFDTSMSNSTVTSVSINTNGHTLTLLGGGMTVTSTDNSSTTISGSGNGILIGANQSWANDNDSVPLTISTGIVGAAVGSSSTYVVNINGIGTGGVFLEGPISDGTAGGNLGLVFNQTGITVLQGTNTFTGGAYIYSGTVDLASSLGIEGSTVNMSGGAVTFDSSVPSNSFTFGGLSGSGNLALQNTASSPIVLSVGTNNASTGYSGVLSGPGSLVKVGTGVLSLAASNTYAGTTNISGGTLQLGAGGSLPTSTTLGFAGAGTFDLNGQTQSVASLIVAQGGSGTIINGALATNTITFSAANASTSVLSNGSGGSINGGAGTITINASAAGGPNVATGVVETVGTQLTTTGGVTIAAFGNTSDNGNGNSAVFSLTNTNNNFTGGVNISQGLVSVSAGDGIFNNAGNASTNVVSIATGAGFIAPTSVALNTSSIVLVGNGNHYLRPYGAAVLTINGNISGTGASSGLYMIDSGITVLAGSNSYLGPTTINNGVVNVTGNQTAATGGWNVGIHSAYTATANFNASSVVSIPATSAVVIGSVPGSYDSGSANETLTDASTTPVESAGTLAIGRSGYMNINSGATWNQSGALNVQPISASGYSAYLAVNSGGTFNYNGSTPIDLTPSIQNGGYGEITINGGTFNTSQGFVDGAFAANSGNAYNSSGLALVQLISGGSIVLSANVPNLTASNGSSFVIQVGNNSGGIINTNGYNTSISSVISNASTAGVLTKNGVGTLTLNSVNNYSGGTTVNAGALVLAAGLSSAGTGTITVNGGGLVIRSSDLPTVTNLVKSGFKAGSGYWNGTGINSTAAANDTTHLTALGAILNDNGMGTSTPLYGSGGAIASTFEGAVPIDGDMLVKYTYYGDTDLNGEVDGSDYSRVDASYLAEATEATPFSTGVTGWFNGDFNYDGVVDGSDYTLMDNAFNSQGAVISAEVANPTALIAGGSAAVPEPAALSLLGIGAAGLLGRRRRK